MNSVVLYMAISADGFIAGNNDDVDWVSDNSWESYMKFVETCDVVLVGSRTFTMMEADEFVEGVKYIVVTRNQTLDTSLFEKRSIQHLSDMPDTKKIGVIGGGELNGRLMQMGVIDEIILDVEPVLLGAGIPLFGAHTATANLKLLQSNRLGESGMQLHYEVIR